MKIIFSRKGFDSGSGGCASPILDGQPISIPIPTTRRSVTTYDDLELGDIVQSITKGRISGSHLCHLDPMFENGRCAFGQTGAAQTHLRNNNVQSGDIFLFFGLFANADGGDKHHRIFGYLKVEDVRILGENPSRLDQPEGFTYSHPHVIGEWNPNNCLYIGSGRKALHDSRELRLSKPGYEVCFWQVPAWLRSTGLTYHQRLDRWHGSDGLEVVKRGQEFVADIRYRRDAIDWAHSVIELIDGHYR